MVCITEEEFLEAVDGMEGFCTSCQEFTRGETEPDARGYPCPKCELNKVVGAEHALECGFFEFVEEEKEEDDL